MPNFSLKAPAIFSATDRSIAVYQTTLPSFLAASINGGEIASAGGAAARTEEANTVPSASGVEAFNAPCSMWRLESFRFGIAPSGWLLVIGRAPGSVPAARLARPPFPPQPDF